MSRPGVESSLPVKQLAKWYDFNYHVSNRLCLVGSQDTQLLQYATEAFGRKVALYIIWLTLVVVSIRLVSVYMTFY